MSNAIIYIENLQEKMDVDENIEGIIKNSINQTLDFENVKFDVEVSISFVDNEEIQAINKEHRGKDSVTDVLSFPMLEFDEKGNIIDSEFDINYESNNVVLGDIVISIERAKEQAEEFGHSFNREIGFLAIHSMLHLLGYDHEIDEQSEKLMFGKQKEILALLGLERN